jgi:glycosyltransferase involved in cell wall biosynthesis
MKKILFVVDENRMGGVSILLEDMMKMINRKNKKIDILVLHNSGDRLKDLPNDVNVIYGSHYFDVIDLPIKEIIKSKSIKNLIKKFILVFDMKTGLIKYKIKRERRKILKENYDIEIAFKDGFTAIFTIFGDSLKKIHWLHYDYKQANPNAKYSKLFNQILPQFDNVIAVSKGIMDDFNKIYHLEDKTQVISNLIDINKIKNKSLEIERKKEKKLEIISVGRLHYMKGYDRFIRAINRLRTDKLINKVSFKIYGDGPEKNNLESLINKLGLNRIITLEGKVNNPYTYIKDTDLFVLSSLYEPFGLVIIEALTLGVPVLATQNSATDKLINDNVNGLIVENSEEGIYKGLKKILKEQEYLIKLKENAKKFDYSCENKKILKELQDLFN